MLEHGGNRRKSFRVVSGIGASTPDSFEYEPFAFVDLLASKLQRDTT